MRIDVVMPRAGLTMVEGTIQRWLAEEGSFVERDTPLMEYENEKNEVQYDALDSGYLHIVAPEGETAKVGALIAWLASSEEEYQALLKEDGSSANSGAASDTAPQEPIAAAEAPQQEAVTEMGRVRATGYARKIAAANGVDLAQVKPSGGPDGRRIVAKDVEQYMSTAKAAAPAALSAAQPVLVQDEQDVVGEIKLTGMQKTIARNMLASSQNMALCTGISEFDVTELVELRKKLLACEETLGYRVTLNDLLCKMIAKVIVKYPKTNGIFDGETIKTHSRVHLGVAVASEEGLRVPVVRNADLLNLKEISETVKDLALKTRENRLTQDEQSGATFTITNFGIFPIDAGTIIVNTGQVAICGFGRIVKKPMFVNGELKERDMIQMSFTYDHRVMDGLSAGRIFKDVEFYLTHPEAILA